MKIKTNLEKIRDKISLDKKKKFLDYEVQKKENLTLQEKAIKALGIFFVIMVLCTILSRFANTLTVPIVTVDALKSSKISDQIVADGHIVKNYEKRVKVAEGLKVNNINVNVGSSIKKGDIIAELDLEDIKEKVAELNKNITKEKKTIQRANEDYNKGITEKQEVANKALKEKNEAQKKLEEQQAKQEENNEELVEGLKAELQAKQEEYNSAVKASNDVIELSRRVEDAKDNSEIDKLTKELSKLQPYLSSNGKIIANEDGIVTSIFANNGEETTDTIISIADKNVGFKFVAQIDSNMRSLVKLGQIVDLQLSKNEKIVEDLTIKSIAPNVDNPDMFDITVELPVETGEINDLGKLIISDKTKNYDSCIPISAIRQSGEEYYILVASEMDMILGKELVATRVDIDILKKDDGFAAIEGLVSSTDKIIIDSNKNIEDGDRIRLEE